MAAIFYRALDAGSRSPVPQWRGGRDMNQSAAFKDFFLIPWPRIRYLAWISYALSYGFSYRFLSSFPSHRFPPSPFSISSFNVQGMVCLLATRWEKEKERKGREGRKPLEIGNAEKTVGLLRCRVRSCSRVDPARVGIKRGKGVSHGGNFCSRLVVGDLLFFFFWDLKGFDWRSIRDWRNWKSGSQFSWKQEFSSIIFSRSDKKIKTERKVQE